MTKLKITVTKEILERSKYCSNKSCEAMINCAISLAIRDIWPLAKVHYSFISPYPNNGKDIVSLPPEASEFIGTFDFAAPEDRLKMAEISFEIEIPDSVINQINIDELKPLLINHPTLELVEQK